MSTQTLGVSSPTLNHKYYGRTRFLSSTSFTAVDNRYEWFVGDIENISNANEDVYKLVDIVNELNNKEKQRRDTHGNT